MKLLAFISALLFSICSCQKNKNEKNNTDLKNNSRIENPVKDVENNTKVNKSTIKRSLLNISDFQYKKYRYENRDHIESIEMANFLHTSLPFFINKGGGIIEESNFATDELVLSESKTDNDISNKRVRYVFIHERTGGKLKVRDTLKIAKGLDYSQVLLHPDRTQFGICIGKYYISKEDDEYFEISTIYRINEQGKLLREPLNTIIYDCPAPADYIRDEEPNSYRFGIKGGKKLERFWYEN